MKLDKQRQWYENWHRAGSHEYPVEILKQRMRLEAIQRVLQVVECKRVLVIGCGQGDELMLLQAESISAFDLSIEAVHNARQLCPSGHYMQADGMNLPFANQSFDLVLSSEVLEHILEPAQMLAEIRRILVPGGHVLITTPNWSSFFGLARRLGEWVTHTPVTSDGQPVDNWSTGSSLRSLLHSADLNVVQVRGAWYFPPTGWGTKRLPDRLMASIFKLLLPLERRLQSSLPEKGHLLVALAQRLA